MATTIQIKRSTGSAAPGTSDLVEGELAYAEDRTGDGARAKLYISSIDSGGSEVIQEVGGKYYTDLLDNATNANTASTIVKRDYHACDSLLRMCAHASTCLITNPKGAKA